MKSKYIHSVCSGTLVGQTSLPWTSCPNYNIFQKVRTAKGGGVAIYCRDSLQSSVILSRSVPKTFELLLLKIHLSRNKSLTVAACYFIFLFFISPFFNQVDKLRTSSHLQLRPGQDKAKQFDTYNDTELHME